MIVEETQLSRKPKYTVMLPSFHCCATKVVNPKLAHKKDSKCPLVFGRRTHSQIFSAPWLWDQERRPIKRENLILNKAQLNCACKLFCSHCFGCRHLRVLCSVPNIELCECDSALYCLYPTPVSKQSIFVLSQIPPHSRTAAYNNRGFRWAQVLIKRIKHRCTMML